MSTEVRVLLQVGLLADLRLQPVDTKVVILMVGRDSMDDGFGGFYRWDSSSAVAEDTFLNVVQSTISGTGRWVRVFQRIKILPHGYLEYNGGIKRFFSNPINIDTNSQAAVYLTMDGTSGGTAIFTTVFNTDAEVTSNISSANDVIQGCRKTLISNLLTYYFARGNSQTLGATLLNIAGTVIPGLRAAPSGTPVVFRAEGI